MAKHGKKRGSRYGTLILLFVLLIALAASWLYLRRFREEMPVYEGEFSVHFLELGNQYAGDCILLKAGDTEVLIDAGSRESSAKAICDYLGRYCTDGVLEYVVATHAHQDHIAAFVGTSSAAGIFARFECKTIIDFPMTNSTSKIYRDYVAARDAEVEAGAKHYTALQCYRETDDAKRSYALGEGITMEILYQRFYEENSSNENNYSVCLMVTNGKEHYLFTGDLEKEGEKSLVEENRLPVCKLFKGGHHGSYTASSEELLSVIRPEYVVVCCCAGSPEYTEDKGNTFPAQAMIDRVARYTKNIYVTSLATDAEPDGSKWGYTSMNGNIVFTSNGGEFSVHCSHNDTLLKDTDWFQKNRVWPEYGVK